MTALHYHSFISLHGEEIRLTGKHEEHPLVKEKRSVETINNIHDIFSSAQNEFPIIQKNAVLDLPPPYTHTQTNKNSKIKSNYNYLLQV